MQKTNRQIVKSSLYVGLLVISGFLLTMCDTVSQSDNNSNTGHVGIQFRTISSSSTPAAKMTTTATAQQKNGTISIKGSNGTLTINDVRFIVDDFELEQADAKCSTVENNENTKNEDIEGCEEFEFNLIFVDLPLNGGTIDLNTSPIETGLYQEMEFEVENLDLNDDEQDAIQQKQDLLAQIRNTFPNWPKTASMVISGSFTNNQGETTDFVTFANAEVEIEMNFDPPIKVTDNSAEKMIMVKISPENWFKRNDGTVINLANYDYSSTGKILKFESEIENGFVDVETNGGSEED